MRPALWGGSLHISDTQATDVTAYSSPSLSAFSIAREEKIGPRLGNLFTAGTVLIVGDVEMQHEATHTSTGRFVAERFTKSPSS